MKQALAAILLTCVGVVALRGDHTHVTAQETPTGPPSASPTPAVASATPATTSVAAATPEPTNTPDPHFPDGPPPPQTLGPFTPTPALPEEGGPAGGVVSGILYIDTDRSGGRTPSDTGAYHSAVTLERVNEEGNYSDGYGVLSGRDGEWEVRSLPDGHYRVYWIPPVEERFYDQTIPPAEEIVLSPLATIRAVTTVVTITGANRVSGIEWGMPAPAPRVGGAQLPETGSGTNTGPGYVLLGVALGISLMGALALPFVRRRSSERSR